ncbi:MAG TPA: peroxiredoxin, partial [Rudaea sp.]|nr:peroxiredoxin [Rudaea sp.]
MNHLMKLAAIATVCIAGFSTSVNAALKVGAKAPDFTLPAYLAGNPFTFDLAGALKKGPVVVYFFPAAHT